MLACATPRFTSFPAASRCIHTSLALAVITRSRSRKMVSAAVASPATAEVPTASHSVTQDYEALSKKLKDVSALGGISGLLGWDEMVMLPGGAAESRATQKAALAGVIHEKSTSPEIGGLLASLQAADLASLDEYQRAVVREAARDYKKATAVTEELVRREAELESRGYATWVKARQAKDFSLFAPVLEEWVVARRERAALVDPSAPAYDVLADDYSAGLTAARITEIFDQVKEGLIPFLADLRARGTAPESSWLEGEYNTDAQAALCRELAIAIGFDLEKGRLDVSVHPFTGGTHPSDVRMTTRFKANDVTEGITGAIHETGHALYEQGRNLQFDGLPVNAAAGMAVHESQSLLWERMVALSRPFSAYLLPKLRAAFEKQLPEDKTAEDLYRALNVVRPQSMIRVEADEVTYPLHIILRFEIERGLIEGTTTVDEIPALWNAKMKEYLGVEPADEAQGCLQDVHWSAGLFGYFPTYTLGAMCAVQIFNAARKDLPDLDADLAAGRFAPLKQWLNTRVHSVGSLYPTADELMEAVTGSPLDPSVFLSYIRDKYSELYKL